MDKKLWNKIFNENKLNESSLIKKKFDKVVNTLSKLNLPITVIYDNNDIELVVGMNAPDELFDKIWKSLDKAKIDLDKIPKIHIVGGTTTLDRKEYEEIKRIGRGHKNY